MKTNEERLPELEALESLRFDFECEFELIIELTKFVPPPPPPLCDDFECTFARFVI